MVHFRSQIYSFRLNLPQNLKNEVKYRKPTSLLDAINIARTFYDSHPQEQIINSIIQTKWCKYHQTNTHSTEDCRAYKHTNNNKFNQNNRYAKPNNFQGYKRPHLHSQTNYDRQNKSNYKNYNSNQNNRPDKQFIDNYQPRKQTRQDNNLVETTTLKNNENANSASRSNTEFNSCNTNSSRIKEITMVESDNNLMCSTALINGIEVPILFDTGASQSVIPLEIVQQYKLPYYTSNITCNFGNNSKQENVPITNPLEVIIHDTVVQLEFLVLPRHNVLIGCDWLNITETSVSTYNKSLIFKKRTIFLEPDLNIQMDQDNEDTTDILSTEMDPIDISYAEESSLDYWPLKSKKIKFIPITSLNSETNNKLLSILEEYRDVFATSVEDLKEPCNLGEHVIDTENNLPISLKPYRKSKYEQDIIDNEIESLLKAGIIRPSKSAWSAPIVLIPKPDGTKRMCINYKKLNNITKKDAYPIPRIDEIFTRFSKSKYFSKLDFRQAYYQIKMDTKSIEKTAFSTSDGLYEFIRLPFGLTNAPKDFNRLMENVFHDFKKFVEHFFDDATAHSSNIDIHLIQIKRILQKLREVNLKLNYDKCKFFQTEIKLFGHIISESVIRMNPDKLKVIRDWPVPTNTKNLSSFLGMTGYYRRYVDHFSSITASLNALLRKDTPWYFGVEQIKQFNFLKQCLLTEPILRQPDLYRQFFVYCDASGLG